ncbi:Rta1 domain protein [Neofusicoccum parvum]|uniref:Rta1 domain protein n=1 Tax=Neofusicoccum parvum TaxID=310453 RepID=A0ACB5SLJ0_9PEZI|nr:Rta1 domain protein [Neofusicoccum parvum]
MSNLDIVPAIIATAIFLAATLITAYKAHRHGTWMLWSLILSGFFLVVSYTFRAVGFRTDSDGDVRDPGLIFLADLFNSVASFFLTWATFTLFTRLTWWTSPSSALTSHSPLWFHPRFGFPIMLAVLLISVAAQCIPVPLIILCGLVPQTVLLLVYLTFVFRYRSVRATFPHPRAVGEKSVFMVAAAVGIVLLVRSVLKWIAILTIDEGVRAVGVVYFFDALQMLICFVLFNLLHPGKYLPADFARFRLDKSAVLQRKSADSRVAELTRETPRSSDSTGPGLV